MKNNTKMDSDIEEEDASSNDEFSEDDIVEDLEEPKDNKRAHSDMNDIEEEDDDTGLRGKRMKFTSEKEMKKLSKPATAEELNRLKETENLFHSNLFRLQIEEMLKEVQLKQKHKKAFNNWFKKLRTTILKLEDGRERRLLSDEGWLKSIKVKIPIPKLPDTGQGTYQFQKPVNVEMVGSYPLETLVGPKVTVDVMIELPAKFYEKDDFINGTYHIKRALYLCDLISHLQKCNELIEDVNFLSDGVEVLKPKIEIIPAGKLAKCFSVVLNVHGSSKGIDLSRFNPSKNNVKMKWFFNADEEIRDSSYDSATPFYNSTILSDLTFKDNYKCIAELLEKYKNVKDGIILLKVWLRQRELSSCLSDFSGYLITMLVLYLIQIRKINSFMSSYQVVRTVLNYLVTSDWTSNGITLCKTSNDRSIPSMTEFHNHQKLVFIDSTGYYNICYGMHPSVFHQVKHEAQIALNTLDDGSVNSFQILFITPVPFYRHFDQLIIFQNDEALQNTVEIYGSAEDKLNYCGTPYSHLINMIYDLLEKGLKRRVNCLRVRQPQPNRWKAHRKFRHTFQLTFGLNLNPEFFYLTLDKAAEGEAEAFRELWGERSELRRFQDGSITEAVVWDAKHFSEKRMICKQIVTYLMKSKFGIDGCDICYVGNQFDEFIGENLEESSLKVRSVFDKLGKQLRNLKNLPLGIISAQGISPVLRYTDVYPLSSISDRENVSDVTSKKKKTYERVDEASVCVPTFLRPVELVLQMCATNKWPHDLGAIDRLRTAFYIKIGQAVRDQCQLRAKAFPDRLEILKDGVIFHLRIFCPNEIGLIKKTVENGVVKYRDNEFSLMVEKQMVFLPKLSSALHGLYEQHSSFGPACCIVKRWVNSQMIDSFHISDEVLEMLVAYLYLKPSPHEVPQQPQTAFFRFLRMIAHTDWNSEFILLNINNELNREDILDIESYFTANRDTLPPLFIVTPYDKTKSIWTKDCPTALILLRLVQMCKHTLQFIEKRIFKNIDFQKESRLLFETSLDPYDAIIHLTKNSVPKVNVEEKYVDSEDAALPMIPVNGFNPVTNFLKELREAYDDIALFFYNMYEGFEIGVLWKPNKIEAKEFKVANMAMHTYLESTKKLHLEKELIIQDFMVIGKGIVKSVDVNEDGERKTYTYL